MHSSAARLINPADRYKHIDPFHGYHPSYFFVRIVEKFIEFTHVAKHSNLSPRTYTHSLFQRLSQDDGLALYESFISVIPPIFLISNHPSRR
jgi:hypothetical protein